MPKTSGTRAFNDANCSELQIALGTEDVACVIDANTFVLIQEESVILRSTVTSIGGKFKDNVTRRVFWIISN
jgi:GTP cyclohydrolase I